MAASQLAEEGVDVGVIDMHTIKPLDEEAVINAAKTTGRIVTAEEHSVIGGLGSAVAEVTSKYCPVRIEMVGQHDTYGESGKPEELKEKYGMTILQPAQEEKQQRRLEEKLAGNKYQDEIEDVFHRILRNSKRIQARKLFPYNIVLIGFMGAGKSAISDFLSTMFDMRLVEMDQEISERQEMSIPDIFATYGEEYFRNLETELLRELRAENGCVISCGGGVALREENVAEMKKNGRVVLLTASPETIYERVKDSNDRPLLNGNNNVEFIADLMEKRREKYEAAADVVIRTDHKTVLQSCEELITKLMELDGK